MPRKANNGNLGVRHGEWGEAVAVEHLRRHGFEIVDRNARPVERDRRLEIDIVAWERESDTLVFVEVKQHKKVSAHARRLQGVNRKKRLNLRRACVAWRRVNRWHGDVRFDVMEIYGVPQGGSPVIDHIRDVHLFGNAERFVRWSGEE